MKKKRNELKNPNVILTWNKKLKSSGVLTLAENTSLKIEFKEGTKTGSFKCHDPDSATIDLQLSEPNKEATISLHAYDTTTQVGHVSVRVIPDTKSGDVYIIFESADEIGEIIVTANTVPLAISDLCFPSNRVYAVSDVAKFTRLNDREVLYQLEQIEESREFIVGQDDIEKKLKDAKFDQITVNNLFGDVEKTNDIYETMKDDLKGLNCDDEEIEAIVSYSQTCHCMILAKKGGE